ncbi:MAG: hypothetical protein IMZ43_11110 [Thermoplasmata archaeon]|nr:hypothetical protein [Thermoplasmata archaeon]
MGTVHSFNKTITSDQKIVAKISREIEIPAGSDYYIKFDSQNLTLKGQDVVPYSEGLSDKVIAAIAKSPLWIQRALIRQFQNLSTPEPYADILLNASKQYADEIAFSIACCPSGRVPSAALLKENAESLYERDQWIQYADIVESDDGTGNYSSTIRYTVLENGTEKQIDLPTNIYYWYVVHPKITIEDVDATYGPLWRDYLFEHNDLGYPLLKEKLSTVRYLWDCTSYYQFGGRLWSDCMKQHPTAIEAVSYWIGKTVPYPAIGDRPGQSCVIAHEHNGWCGELQKIAVAAQRAALIPSITANNVGEDHVWREFYERGWHENDNWWSDTGGAVDEPDVYAYGWGKNMSAIYQWRGDGTILDDTARYIHPEDRIAVSFIVKDSFLQPVDGARVIVLVKGPKDITWYKNYFWEKIQGFWDKLPEFLKGKLLSFLFERFKDRFDKIPDGINGITITTWNYTNLEGRCSFELGKNLEYLFLIQQGNLKKPWQLARHNTVRSLKTQTDKEFKILLLDVSHKPQQTIQRDMPSGDCQFSLSFTSTAYQSQKNFNNDGIGSQEPVGSIECFFVDQENFQRYKDGKRFTCNNFLETENATLTVSALNQDWYVIFRNAARQTHIVIDFSLDVAVPTTIDRVQIVSPDTSLFETPIYNSGDTIPLSGIATTDQVHLTFDHEPPAIEVSAVNGEWSYAWNTSEESPGLHSITVTSSDNTSDEGYIRLIDAIPPSLSIDSPVEGAILEHGIINISGQSSDNLGVDHVEITLDNISRQACGTTTWNLSWDVTGLPLGDYVLSVKAVDTQGLVSIQTRSFVLNESGHVWGPQINTFYHVPANLTNTSNVIIYANVTVTGPFAINTIVLYCNNGTDTTSSTMYRYGDFPIQSRHEEDPLINQSNDPVFGIELGQFSTGQTITYWIVASDTAQNKKQSDVASFTIL